MIKKMLLLIVILVIFTGAAFTSNIPDHNEKVNLAAYFPAQVGRNYKFRGEGDEFAYFERELIYVREPFLQLHDISGTSMAKIYKIESDQISLISSQAEFYENKNLLLDLNKDIKIEEIILKTPLKKGMQWETNGKTKEIFATDMIIKVPAGIFHDVIIIKINYPNQDSNNFGFDYYAKNMGLIKSEYIISDDDYRIVSELETFNQLKSKIQN